VTATAPTDAHHTLEMPDSAADASKLSRPAQLLLVRLLASAAAKRPPTRAAVLKDLRKLSPELPEDDLTGFHQQLAAAGLADSAALRLTAAGRAHALSMLGLGALPAKPTWKSLLDQHLFPLAAGVAPDARETRQKLRTAGFLKSYLVRKHYGLTGGPTAPLAKVLEALACRELGFPEYSDLKSVQAAVLSRLVGSAAEPLKLKDLEKQVPRTALGVSNDKPDTLRGAVIRRWLAGGSSDGAAARHQSSASHAGGPFDLRAFAAAALRAARQTPSAGWFGDNKVFIARAWRQFQSQPDAPPGVPSSSLDLPAFKKRLVEANREGLLRLSRADLVSAMDPADVRESETRYLNAEFHFILIEGVPR
jgi:hypothetical protein